MLGTYVSNDMGQYMHPSKPGLRTWRDYIMIVGLIVYRNFVYFNPQNSGKLTYGTLVFHVFRAFPGSVGHTASSKKNPTYI